VRENAQRMVLEMGDITGLHSHFFLPGGWPVAREILFLSLEI
jgi:hypothetical protein